MKLTPLIAACAVLALGSACGATKPEGAAAPPSAPASANSAAPQRTSTEEVHQVALTRADLPDGYAPDSMKEGDRVAGSVTMDLCGADFPSEALRVVRRQVRFEVHGGDQAVSNEVVAYRPGGAEQALRELRDAVAHCPSGYVKSNVVGVPDTRTKVRILPNRSTWQSDTFAIAVSLTAHDGTGFAATGIFQRHGDVLSILYLEGAGPLSLLPSLPDLVSTRLDSVAIGTGA